MVKRVQMLPFFADRSAARIVIKAYGSAHYWPSPFRSNAMSVKASYDCSGQPETGRSRASARFRARPPGSTP
ncbi:hypothetical protein EGY19_29425 [Burkholderia multivorans]|nr:hypothetical protein EGY19_29425 [Burkholderia multivorans]PRG53532.1 hypothetical protein C6T63_10430 [Burkholderia multivorans]